MGIKKIKIESADPTGLTVDSKEINLEILDEYYRVRIAIGDDKYIITDNGETIYKIPK